MKPKTLVTLVFAVGCGLVTMFLLKQANSGKDTESEPTVPVLMAEMDIEVGKRIQPEWVRFRDVPQSMVPEGAITDPDQYKDRALTEAAVAGQMLKITSFGEPGDFGTSIKIPEGMRIVAIPVSEADSFSGMLQPGDRVDVDVTYKLEQIDTQGRRFDITKNKVLLEYVQVFNVDNRSLADNLEAEDASRVKTVGLIVTPEQKGWLKLAQEKGKLSIAWRKESDDVEVKTEALEEWFLEELNGAVKGGAAVAANTDGGDVPAYDLPAEDAESEEPADSEPVDFAAILNQTQAAALPAAPPEPVAANWTIEIIRNGNTETVEVPMPVEEVQPEVTGEEMQDPTETAGRMLRSFFGL